MNCSRGSADLAQHLTGRWPNGRWRGWDVFRRQFWRNPYLLHDTFGKRWARLVTCRFRGHLPVVISLCSEPPVVYCFRCESYVNGWEPGRSSVKQK